MQFEAEIRVAQTNLDGFPKGIQKQIWKFERLSIWKLLILYMKFLGMISGEELLISYNLNRIDTYADFPRVLVSVRN